MSANDELIEKVSNSMSADEQQIMKESCAKFEETAARFMVSAIAAKAREAGTTLTAEDEEYIKRAFKAALMTASMLA